MRFFIQSVCEFESSQFFLCNFLHHISETSNLLLTMEGKVNFAKLIKKAAKVDEATLAASSSTLTDVEVVAAKKTVERLLSKCQSVKVEQFDGGEDKVKKPKQEFEPFLQSLLMDLRNYENDDNLDRLSFSGGAYLSFRRHLKIDFNPTHANFYLTQIGEYEGQAQRILLFLAADRGLVYSKIKENW